MPLPLIGFFTGGFFAKVLYFVGASVVVRIIAAAGIAIATFTGIDLTMSGLETFINNSIGQFGQHSLDIIGLFGFLFMIQVIISTATGILATKALLSAKKIILK